MEHKLRETLEREIKLTAGPRFRFPNFSGDPLVPRVFTSTYYETTDHRLAKCGITLRRRVEHKKGLWQLKLPSGPARLELEIRGGPFSPPEVFKDLLLALLRGKELLPVAKLRTQRTGVRVQNVEGSLADVVLDRVVVLDKGRTLQRFSEIEIELVSGDETILTQIEAALRSAGAQDGDPRPKIFQALDLSFDKERPEVPPLAPPVDHLKVKLQNQVAEILLHDPGTRFGKDPEELHQMRVATRRSRSLLRAARPLLWAEWGDNLRAEIGWLGGVLGQVRDYDVLLQHLHAEATSLPPPDRHVFERVLAGLETQRSIARGAMLDALRSGRYLQLLNQLEDAADHPNVVSSHISLQDIAAKEFKKLVRAIDKKSSECSDQDLHLIRIQAKRARYAAELAETAVGKTATRFIRQAKVMQDLLGSHQDAIVTEQRLRELIRASRGVKAALAVGQVVERLRASRRQLREAFPHQWAKLKKRGREAWPPAATKIPGLQAIKSSPINGNDSS